MKPDDSLRFDLAYRPPLDWAWLSTYLVSRGAAGTEALDGARYLRTVRIGDHGGWIAAEPVKGKPALRIEASASLSPVLAPLQAMLRNLFDLDANPKAISAHLTRDPRLGPVFARQPGLRVPGALDGFDLALRAVLGQQVSVKAATTIFGRFARAYGEPVQTPFPTLTHGAPSAWRIAAADENQIAALGLPGSRARTVLALARAVTAGGLKLEAGADPEAVAAAMKALPGIGDWTAQYVAMRALRHPDAFPASDLGIYRALGVNKPRDAIAAAEPWRPWRSYAVMQLWVKGSAND